MENFIYPIDTDLSLNEIETNEGNVNIKLFGNWADGYKTMKHI